MPLSYPQDYFTNFAVSTIAGGAGGANTALGASDTSLLLAPGSGQLFPASFPFLAVIRPGSPGSEIIKVTNRATDTLTIVRGQEGTTAPSSWPVGTMIQHIITAANLSNIWTAIEGIISQLNSSSPGTFTTLTVTGASSLDNGKITTNGSGVITIVDGGGGAVSIGTTSINFHDAAGNGTLVVGNSGTGSITTGVSGSMVIGPSWNLSLTPGNDMTLSPTNNLFFSPGVGRVYITNTDVMLAGHQESGVGGAAFSNCTAADVVGIYVNFKTHLQNVPSSITLTPTTTTNVSGSASAANITRDGFFLQWTVNANGLSKWIGTYATVGN